MLCPAVCDPMSCSPPGSSVHGILQEYWSGLAFPFPGDFLNPGIEAGCPALQADSLQSEPPGKPRKIKGSEVKVAQSCLTLSDPKGYTVHRILQARILGWVAFPVSRGSSQPRD